MKEEQLPPLPRAPEGFEWKRQPPDGSTIERELSCVLIQNPGDHPQWLCSDSKMTFRGSHWYKLVVSDQPPARQEGETKSNTPIMDDAMGWHDRRDILSQIGMLEMQLSAKQAEVERLTVAKRSAEELWQVQVNRTNSARAELESLKAAQGWRPIDENTPRDGTKIDVWAGGCRYTDAFWGRGKWRIGYGDGINTPSIEPEVTHWMPLPTPPVERSENKG